MLEFVPICTHYFFALDFSYVRLLQQRRFQLQHHFEAHCIHSNRSAEEYVVELPLGPTKTQDPETRWAEECA